MSERVDHVGRDDLPAYLKTILSRYSGYPFISLSKPQEMMTSEGRSWVTVIRVHRHLPAQNEKGFYSSDQDINVRIVAAQGNDNFPGMVMDRQQQAIFGNPFKPVQKDQLPDLGKDEPMVTETEPL